MKRKFVEERNWSTDEMTPEEREVAARLCEDLFDELAVDSADVLDVIQTATEIWPNGTEVNGQPVDRLDGDTGVVIQDYPEDRRLALDEIEWVRIEGYGGKNEMDYDGQAILYVYLPIKNGKVDKQEVSFDFYPDKNTDDYYDSVGYVDVKSHGVQNTNESDVKKEVFTIEVSYIDEEGEPQMIEAMKYAKTYYTYEEALTAAKEAYLEYAEICEEPVEVMVMGGEYEMPSGDIYGEPDVIEVVTADTIDSLMV